uniref:Slit-2 n=1 Tax=Schmidtea mediterranea TaxID=79327 RepID=I1ZIL5_SCHMD|nr:slit-2 [Schmidtea mediterranea]
MYIFRCIYRLLLTLIIELLTIEVCLSIRPTKDSECPELCNQGACKLTMLLCETPGLLQIPMNPPRGIQKVILSNQNFLYPRLTYTNLSRYGSEEIILKKLTISNCSLTSIESEAFSHLIYLQELDLSSNRLLFIYPNTFKSLSLKTLVLDSNRNLQLAKDSFRGLVVQSLSMKDCHLKILTHESIKQISGYLTTLNLADNRLEYLSNDFDLLFRGLDNLNLENNLFNCSCQLKWLALTLQTRTKRRDNSPKHSLLRLTNPVCEYPKNLKGSSIENLSIVSFQCQIPKLQRIDIKVTSEITAEISCISDDMSNSQVKWRYRYNLSPLFYRYPDQNSGVNQASIIVSKKSEFDFYSCLIINENGNATVDIKIKWPTLNKEYVESPINSPPNTVNQFNLRNNITKSSVILKEFDKLHVNYLWIKQYTFIEMVLAICGTFIITLVTFILLYVVINYRRKNSRSKNILKGYEVGVYSESQTYDVPQMSPYHESNTGRLLDFKTQQEIKATW